ncbi:MAG: hypothetical protein ACJZ15_07940 [Candidatus Neomarinimicrobiota bacterium]|tara:strand:+ start:1883 stop:2863 length:981 start_codon:yes stop_codon:yes gene_type:complete
MNSNNKNKKLIQIVIIGAFAFYNYTTVININSVADRLSYIDNKISLAKFQSSKIPELLASNKENVDYVESIVTSFDSDVDYLESLNNIKQKCKTYKVTVNELTSELKDNLSAPQGAFENYDRTIERYQINLKASGSYLNLGKLLDNLFASGYMLSSMKIDRISSSRVSGYFTLNNYISKPLKEADISNVNFDKVIKNTPLVVTNDLVEDLKWGKDIFLKAKKISKPKPNNRAYYLTRVNFSANPSAIINGKAYKEGSVLDIYTIKDITNDSVTLSSSKKSIVLQLESDVTPQVGSSGFKEEFIKARRNGQSYFEYKGKLYSTDLNN